MSCIESFFAIPETQNLSETPACMGHELAEVMVTAPWAVVVPVTASV